MIKKILVCVVLVMFFFSAAAFAEHSYVGVKKCSMCHKSDARGNQSGQWLSTKHARAYHTLGTPEAAEAAKQAGVSGFPQEAPECLKCHTTAYGVDESLLGSGFNVEDGVQCEACHGPGSKYKSMSVMKDHAKSVENGLIVPTEEVCEKCHNDESPNFQGFNFDEYSEKIKHPKP